MVVTAWLPLLMARMFPNTRRARLSGLTMSAAFGTRMAESLFSSLSQMPSSKMNVSS